MAALESFVSLNESVPSWIERLEHVARQVAERHAEFSRLSRSNSLTGVSGLPLRKPKTGSTESLRPDDLAERPLSPQDPPPAAPPSRPTADPSSSTPPPTPPPARVDINPDNRRLFQEFREQAQARRKRKSSASIVSGQASGPARFRARLSLIVYYDSAVQEGLALLVRNVAAARNNLRKARMALGAAARLAGLGLNASTFARGRADPGHRSPKLARLASPDPDPSVEAFESLDKELEAAQSLCEIGAHQFLRDGTCAEEISGTLERFEMCARMAQEQIARLSKEEESQKGHVNGNVNGVRPNGENHRDGANDADDLRVDDALAVDPLAVDPLAVDPLAVDPLAVDPLAVSPLAADPLAVDSTGADTSANLPPALRARLNGARGTYDDREHGPIEFDGIMVDDALKIEPGYVNGKTKVTKITTDPLPEAEPGPALAVGSVPVDKALAVDTADMSLAIDGTHGINGLDEKNDMAALKASLTAYRRTRRT